MKASPATHLFLGSGGRTWGSRSAPFRASSVLVFTLSLIAMPYPNAPPRLNRRHDSWGRGRCKAGPLLALSPPIQYQCPRGGRAVLSEPIARDGRGVRGC